MIHLTLYLGFLHLVKPDIVEIIIDFKRTNFNAIPNHISSFNSPQNITVDNFDQCISELGLLLEYIIKEFSP